MSDLEIRVQIQSASLQVVVEPSGAVGLAAVLSPQFRRLQQQGRGKVGIILCGGNVDLAAMGLWERFLQKA